MQQNIIYILVIVTIGIYLFYRHRNKSKNNPLKSKSGTTPVLNRFAKDLTRLAKEGKIDPVIGRGKEIKRVIQILSRRKKNNPVLIGPPGVGKTAIVEGLALEIVKKRVPREILKKRVLALDLVGMMAGTKYRGEFEQRLKAITHEVELAERNIIIFIDELHILAEARGSEGAIATSDILKPALARGTLQAVGATTPNEYNQYIRKDLTLERRFQPIKINEPTVKITIEILKGLRPIYEDYHQEKITDNALIAATNFSNKYISNRYLPDKAIDLIDEASAKVKLGLVYLPDRIIKLNKEIGKMKYLLENQKGKELTVLKQKKVSKEIKKRQEKIKLLTSTQQLQKTKQPIVGAKEIKEIVSEWIDLPIEKII